MAIIDKKIEVADYTGKDIAGLPDKPSEAGVSASTLKARFDSLTKNLTVVNFNGLIDELVAITASSSLGASTFDGIAGTNVQTLLENLKIYTDSEFATRDAEITAVENGITALNNALGAFKFTQLSDTPSNYTGASGKIVAVNELETGLDFVSTDYGIVPSEDVSIEDVGEYYTNTRVEGVLQEIGLALSTISLNFIGLTDTPETYTGQAGKFPAVKSDESGLEFVDVVADLNIPAFPETTTINDNDLLVVEDGIGTKKITKANFSDTLIGNVTTLTTTSKEVVGAINELDSEKADNSDIGNRTYTEQNVVTNWESITKSIDELDIDLASHKAENASKHITESGSNYIKFDDGTMIQWGNTVNITANIAIGAGFRNEASITLPQPFINTSYRASVAGNNLTFAGIVGKTTSTLAVVIFAFDNGRSGAIDYITIGKWK